MIYFVLAILLCSILYRVPRGTGIKGVPKGGELVWALGTVIPLYFMTSNPLVFLFLLSLVGGEAPGWGKYWPNNNPQPPVWKFNLRGALLLNPVMGYINYWCFRNEYKLLSIPPYLRGWREWAEIFDGFVTGVSYSVLAYVLFM